MRKRLRTSTTHEAASSTLGNHCNLGFCTGAEDGGDTLCVSGFHPKRARIRTVCSSQFIKNRAVA